MALPISRNAALKASRWLKNNFGAKIAAAVADTPFSIDHVCGIACQETAYRWLEWLDDGHSTDEILGACVLDGSGDFPGTSRSAFPKNTAAFRAKYGDAFTKLLVAEGNKMREFMGWGKVDWLYKGYGIFQYDLQFVEEDEAYFRNRSWHDFDACLAKLMGELKVTWAWVLKNHGDKPKAEKLRLAIRKYNGAGAAAEEYSKNVVFYAVAASEVVLVSSDGGGGNADPVGVVTGIEFEMELGGGGALRKGTLIVKGANRAVFLLAEATSGRPGHQDAGNQWEMGQGPLPAVPGYEVRTMVDLPESNAQLGQRFVITPQTVENPAGGDSRSGFYVRGPESKPGTSGGLALLFENDFAKLQVLLAATVAAGVKSVPLKVTYTGGVLDVKETKLKKLEAVFSMKLANSATMLYGTFVITSEDGTVLYSGRATSGQRGYQYPAKFWDGGKGVLPPTKDDRFIMTNVWNNDAPMGTRYQITPEEVWNSDRTKSRSAFRVHFDGGAPGSAGCIVTPAKADYDRVVALFAALKAKGIKQIPLTLNYT